MFTARGYIKMTGLETIVGERITLRAFKDDDAYIYASWLEDEDLCIIVNEKKRSAENVKEYQRKLTYNPNFIEYIVVDNKTGLPIGDISINLENRNSAGLRPTWGLMLGSLEYRHGGYGSEAGRLLFKFAREKIGLTEIYGEVFPQNQIALDFDKKLGMRVIGMVLDRDGKECYLLLKNLLE
jgi:RimJ/RimL family protein N-acetyltransferase